MGRLFLFVYAVFATIAIIVLYRKYKELKSSSEKSSKDKKEVSSIPNEFIDVINNGIEELKNESQSINIKEGINSGADSDIGNFSGEKLTDRIEIALNIVRNHKDNAKDLVGSSVQFLKDSGFSIDTYFDMFGVEHYQIKGNNYIM